MRRFSSVLVFLGLVMLLSVSGVFSMEISGVNIPDTYQVDNAVLKLNGAGIRRKFIFVKIYIGALYVEKKSHDPKEIEAQPIKVVRMHFLYSHIPAKKIRDAFADDIKRIAGNFSNSEAAKAFLKLFNFDVKKNDTVDLIFYHDTLIVYHNGKKVGEVKSKRLINTVLAIYIGKSPAQESLKKAMLGE